MIQFLGWLATILFTIGYVPQFVRMYNARSVTGLSFWLLFINLVANCVALVYAALIGQWPLLVKYIAAIVMLLPVLFLYWRITRRS